MIFRLILIILLINSFLYAEDSFIQTQENLKIIKELKDKYKIEANNYYYIDRNKKCNNPSSDINTIDCLIVNISKIINNNINLFSYKNRKNNYIEYSNDIKLSFLNDFNNTQYVIFYKIYEINVRTNLNDNKRIIEINVSGLQDNLGHGLDILITLEYLPDNNYKLIKVYSENDI